MSSTTRITALAFGLLLVIGVLLVGPRALALPLEGVEAGTRFDEPTIGATQYVSTGGEIGFTSAVAAVGGLPIHTVGVTSHSSAGRVFRTRNASVQMTFDPVTLPAGARVAALATFQYSKAIYEETDFLRAFVAHESEQVSIVEVAGDAFSIVNSRKPIHVFAPVPPEWPSATQRIDVRTEDPNDRRRIDVEAVSLLEVLVQPRSAWRYRDDGTTPPSDWREPGFDDGDWATGPGRLGWGRGDESTVIASGPPGARHVTSYFRSRFDVANPASIEGLDVWLAAEDGASVSLNGHEIVRDNLPPGDLDADVIASSDLDGLGYRPWHVPADALVTGENILAVEVHLSSPRARAAGFDLVLSPAAAPPDLGLLRAPYLQRVTPRRAVVRWRTSRAVDSVVRYGSAPGDLDREIAIPGERFDHVVELGLLFPGRRYYYSVGSGDTVLAGGDSDHWFETSPVPGSRSRFRIWVTGDTGQCAESTQGCVDAAAVKDAYRTFAGDDPADVWLSLGDMAYAKGTDDEFTRGFFDVYPDITRQTAIWPAPGNHEFGSGDVANSGLQRGPYYASFSLPRGGEAGGVPSGTEAYYAFDYGNVHFVSLDSHDTSREGPADPVNDVCAPGQGGAMYQWLCADLADTSADFTIVYWHHPPYSKGGHDSDDCIDDRRLCEMRDVFVPVLDAFGVDLQLAGHTHLYQRTGLMRGHLGTSDTFSPAEHVVQPGLGDPDVDGGYEKDIPGAIPDSGAVYAVVGSSSKVTTPGSGFVPHAAMLRTLAELGSMVIDVEGAMLDAVFLDETGAVLDRFQIDKGAPPTVDLFIDGDTGPVVETDGTIDLTLDMASNGAAEALDWYLGVSVDGSDWWYTSSGLSATAQPLATLPPGDVQQMNVLRLPVVPGHPLSVILILHDGTRIIAMDIVTGTAPSTEP